MYELPGIRHRQLSAARGSRGATFEGSVLGCVNQCYIVSIKITLLKPCPYQNCISREDIVQFYQVVIKCSAVHVHFPHTTHEQLIKTACIVETTEMESLMRRAFIGIVADWTCYEPIGIQVWGPRVARSNQAAYLSSQINIQLETRNSARSKSRRATSSPRPFRTSAPEIE